MAITINAKTSGAGGLETTADNTGNINIQSGGSTVMSISSTGVSVTGSFSQDGAVYSTQPTFRNLIINGDMNIAQRGTSFTSQTSTAYHLDRWEINAFNISSGVYQIDQDTDAPSGFSNSLKLSCTTANGTQNANEQVNLQQQIEGLNTSHLKYFVTSPDTVTLSFWIKTNLSGTYSVSLKLSDNGSAQDNTATRVYNTTYTVNSANTWERKTVTIQLDSAVGDIQVIDNRFAMATTFWFGAGTSRDGSTVNTWINNGNASTLSDNLNILGSTSNYINVTGVQLEVGSTATDFEVLPYDVELARCMRYYEKSCAYGTVPTNGVYDVEYLALSNYQDNLNCKWQTTFKVEKRATPTITLYGGATGKWQTAKLDGSWGTILGSTYPVSTTTKYLTANNSDWNGSSSWQTITAGTGRMTRGVWVAESEL
jgi:hypothetical protein